MYEKGQCAGRGQSGLPNWLSPRSNSHLITMSQPSSSAPFWNYLNPTPTTSAPNYKDTTRVDGVRSFVYMQSTKFEPPHFRAEMSTSFEKEQTRDMARNSARVEDKADFQIFSLI